MTVSKLPVAVIGAGGFGREVLDVLRDQRRDILGVFDDSPSAHDLTLLKQQDIAYLGTTSALVNNFKPQSLEYLIGIGSGLIRRKISDKLTPRGFFAATLVHSTASLGFGVRLSPGTIICAGARLTTNIAVGRHSHINVNATVGHDCHLADFVSVYPQAAVSGSVTLDEGALVGAGAFIIQGTNIGPSSIIGAASTVLASVPASTTVVGTPARALKK